MSNLQTRLLTSTALAVTVVAFLNLPAEAKETELDCGLDQNVHKTSAVQGVDNKSDFVIIEKDAKKAPVPTVALKEEESTATPKARLSPDEKRRMAKEAGAGHLSAEAIQAEKDRQLGIDFEPMIVNNNGKLEYSDSFYKIKDINLMANHYSYCLEKGNVQLADQALTQLEKMGCKSLGNFSALEGKRLDFNTVAGTVFYNSKENTYFIVWHGTASTFTGKDSKGWETNADNSLISANNIPSAVYETIRDEIRSTLRNEKGLFIAGQEDAQIDAIMTYVKSNLTTDMSIDQLLMFKDSLKAKILENAPGLAKKVSSSKEIGVMDKIDAIFAVKMELLGKQDFIVQEVKAATVTAFSNAITELDKVVAGSKDEATKAHAAEAITGLKSLIQRIRTDLPKCISAGEVEEFASELKEDLDTWMSGKRSLKQKIFGQKNPVDMLKAKLKKDIDGIISSRHDQLKRLGRAHELNFAGKAHRGYTLKVASAGSQIDDIIEAHARKLSDDIRQRSRWVITGHSMAGGLAKIDGATAPERYQKIHGHLPTAGNNRLIVHALSAAPTGDHTFARALERNLGIGNVIDQKVREDIVPVADPLSAVPETAKMAAGKLPVIGEELVSKLDSDYELQIGTPALDNVEDVKKRAQKHFPGTEPSWWNIPGNLKRNKLALPHYGIALGDKQPVGETYGREEHFEPALANPETRDEWNAMLANGGKEATSQFQAKRIVLNAK